MAAMRKLLAAGRKMHITSLRRPLAAEEGQHEGSRSDLGPRVEEQEQAALVGHCVKEMLGAALAKRTSCSHGKARSLLPFLSPFFLSFSSFTANLDRPYHREGDARGGAGQENELQPLESEYKNWSKRRRFLALKRITLIKHLGTISSELFVLRLRPKKKQMSDPGTW
ncbi:uncharacterized protein [Lolium perenne]|uniref:uncharacterized protein n=1 Tax=Lolium perenne TaxID=4522 RepID=UPI0021F5519B|nr:uncharacterized protein LOC127311758 [Lolium perenne]